HPCYVDYGCTILHDELQVDVRMRQECSASLILHSAQTEEFQHRSKIYAMDYPFHLFGAENTWLWLELPCHQIDRLPQRGGYRSSSHANDDAFWQRPPDPTQRTTGDARPEKRRDIIQPLWSLGRDAQIVPRRQRHERRPNRQPPLPAGEPLPRNRIIPRQTAIEVIDDADDGDEAHPAA